MDTVWEIFICYRQVDGQEIAQWLYHNLNNKRLPIEVGGENVSLNVYWDAAAPALSNWQKLHKPALESSRALIVVCTPGLFASLGNSDWVQMELKWWLENRKTAPLLIDATGEGERWVPQQIKKKWPNAQRLLVEPKIWETFSDEKRTEIQLRTTNRILEGICESETKTRFEDLDKQKKLNRRLKISLFIMGLTAMIAVGAFFIVQDQKKKANIMLAQSMLGQAREAILRNDKLSALALSIRGFDLDQSPEIGEKFLAIQYWAAGDFPAAKKHLEKVMNFEFERALSINLMPLQVDRLTQNAALRSAFDDWIILTGQTGEHGYDAVLMFKGLNSRLEEINRNRLLASNQFNSATDYRLQSNEADLSNAINGSGKWDDAYYKNIQELVQVYKERVKNLSSGNGVKEALQSSWSQIQQKLNPGEVMLDFLKCHDRYIVWLLKKSGFPTRIELGKASEIEPLLDKNYKPVGIDAPIVIRHRGLTPSVNTEQNTLSKISAQIWQPIENLLSPEDSILYIIPDGAFSGFQFNTIPVSKKPTQPLSTTKRYDSLLIDKRTIAYLSTAQDMLKVFSVKEQSRNMLLVGGVNFKKAVSNTDTIKNDFADLPYLRYTQKEVESISSIAQDYSAAAVHLLSDTNATEQHFRELAPSSNIIHISSYGWSSDYGRKIVIDSFIQNKTRKYLAEGFMFSVDPMISTGIAFAGIGYQSNKGMNDGRISAFEISGLRLDNVSLVVLSACNTVGEIFAGDGVLGFVSGFKKAGVKNVVATLATTMDSQETVDFFSSFYDNMLGKNELPAVALRKTILESRRKGIRPETWEPYVCYGPIR